MRAVIGQKGQRRLSLLAVAAILLFGIVLQASPAFALDPAPEGTAENPVTGEQITSDTTQFAVLVKDGAVSGITTWLQYIDLSTNPTVDPTQNKWFAFDYHMMLQMFTWFLLPILFVSIIHSIAKGSLTLLIRSVLIYLPIAIIGSVVAIEIVDLLLKISNDMSMVFLETLDLDAANLQAAFIPAFASGSWKLAILSTLIYVLMTLATVALIFVLALREASIYVATFFLPIGFAMLVWPATTKWFRRLVEFLIALIFSKVVMVGALGLGVAMMAGAGGFTPAASVNLDGTPVTAPDPAADVEFATQEQQSGGAWIKSALMAVTVVLISAGSPAMVNGLIAHVGIGGEMASVIHGNMQRHTMVAIYNAADRVLGYNRSLRGIKGPNGQRQGGLIPGLITAATVPKGKFTQPPVVPRPPPRNGN